MDNTVSLLGRYGPVTVVMVFLALLALETILPLRRRVRPRMGRYRVNLFITAIAFIAGTYIVRRIAFGLAVSCEDGRFGLMYLLDMPAALKFAVGFLLMDLTFYYWHRLNHTVMPLWRFHNVHHVDPDLDVTTSFRFHAVEILLSLGFRAAQVALIGVPPILYAVYELVFTCTTAFHHSNLRLPLWLERRLNRVLVTPRMHGIHHSAVRDETNSNYSVVFSLWDLVHRTLRLDVRQPDIEIGVPAYLGLSDNRALGLIAMPLTRQREYWRYPDGRLSLTRAAFAGQSKTYMRE